MVAAKARMPDVYTSSFLGDTSILQQGQRENMKIMPANVSGLWRGSQSTSRYVLK